MAKVKIKRVSIKHDAIMDYLIANPAEPLSQVAAHFGVSQPWLSVIIHSDAFQAALREKQKVVLNATVIPLREKLIGVAHLGLDKLGEALDNASAVTDKEFIADTTDAVLKNLGFSPKSAPAPTVGAQQNNYYLVDKDALASAREKMKEVQEASQTAEGELIDATPTDPAEGV